MAKSPETCARTKELGARWAAAARPADCITRRKTSFFRYSAPEAREILNDLLEKYSVDGELQFTLPDVLKVPPISDHANVKEIVGKFGGEDQLRNAVNELQSLLYAV